MIGNQVLSSFTPLNPILEGSVFLALFVPALFYSIDFKQIRIFRLLEGIGHHYQTKIGIFQSP